MNISPVLLKNSTSNLPHTSCRSPPEMVTVLSLSGGIIDGVRVAFEMTSPRVLWMMSEGCVYTALFVPEGLNSPQDGSGCFFWNGLFYIFGYREVQCIWHTSHVMISNNLLQDHFGEDQVSVIFLVLPLISVLHVDKYLESLYKVRPIANSLTTINNGSHFVKA